MFDNREDAGQQLSKKLSQFKDSPVVVLAIPRGGLPIGAIVAKSLKAPLDVALTKKIGHPYHKEYAIGAVSLDSVILGDAQNIPSSYIGEETIRIRKALEEKQKRYYKEKKPTRLQGKIVIIVDDGVATGNTILATVELVAKQGPDKIIVAIPVAPPSAVRKLKRSSYVDEVICLATPSNFMAVGQFYVEFGQVSDQEAIRLLEECNSG